MNIRTIKISKEFVGINGRTWLGLEGEMFDGDDALESFIKANKLLDNTWAALNPTPYGWYGGDASYGGVSNEDVGGGGISQTDEVSGMKEVIKLIKSKKTLERQREAVYRLKDKDLILFFEKRLDELS